MLQTLVEARLEDGSLLSIERVTQYVLALVFAGFETTTGQVSWALIHLLQNPEACVYVREAVDAVLDEGRPLDGLALRELEPLRNAIRETERLMPVADRHVRGLSEDLEIGGYCVPKDWIAGQRKATRASRKKNRIK